MCSAVLFTETTWHVGVKGSWNKGRRVKEAKRMQHKEELVVTGVLTHTQTRTTCRLVFGFTVKFVLNIPARNTSWQIAINPVGTIVDAKERVTRVFLIRMKIPPETPVWPIYYTIMKTHKNPELSTANKLHQNQLKKTNLSHPCKEIIVTVTDCCNIIEKERNYITSVTFTIGLFQCRVILVFVITMDLRTASRFQTGYCGFWSDLNFWTFVTKVTL